MQAKPQGIFSEIRSVLCLYVGTTFLWHPKAGLGDWGSWGDHLLDICLIHIYVFWKFWELNQLTFFLFCFLLHSLCDSFTWLIFSQMFPNGQMKIIWINIFLSVSTQIKLLSTIILISSKYAMIMGSTSQTNRWYKGVNYNYYYRVVKVQTNDILHQWKNKFINSILGGESTWN